MIDQITLTVRSTETDKSDPRTARPCAANTPITLGTLYLMFHELGKTDEAEWCLDRIIALDREAIPSGIPNSAVAPV